MLGTEKTEVGQKVRELRKAAGMTQQELATAIGVKQSDLSRMENGEYRVSLSSLVKILQTLDMSVSEFFGEKPSLKGDESALLGAFRNLGNDERRQILRQTQQLSGRKVAAG